MNYRYYIKYIITLSSTIFLSYSLLSAAGNNQPPMTMSKSDIEALGIPQESIEEFEKMIKWVNELPEEEKAELERLGQEMERDMRDRGLDPQNPDDIFKYVDESVAQDEEDAIPSIPAKSAPKTSPKIENKTEVKAPTTVP